MVFTSTLLGLASPTRFRGARTAETEGRSPWKCSTVASPTTGLSLSVSQFVDRADKVIADFSMALRVPQGRFQREDRMKQIRPRVWLAALSVLLPAIVAIQSAGADIQRSLHVSKVIGRLIPGLLFSRIVLATSTGAAARGGTAETCVNHQCVPGCQGLACGVVFKLDPTGKVTAPHNFSGPNGGALIEAVGRVAPDRHL